MIRVVTLQNTGGEINALRAYAHAEEVYRDYMYSPECADALGRLSVAYQELGKMAALHALLQGEAACRLIDTHCLEANLAQDLPRFSVTSKGLIAVNLVGGECVEDDVSAWLQEPFRDKPILDKLNKQSTITAIDGRYVATFNE